AKGDEKRLHKPTKNKQKEGGGDEQLRVGNFKKYYAFRLGGAIEGKLEEDSRLSVFKKEWFEGKKALDIGCNSGDMTLEIGTFHPDLITQARASLKEYISKLAVTEAFRDVQKEGHSDKPQDDDNTEDDELPLSFRLWKPATHHVSSADPLPNIGSFASGYEVVSVLSVTKWIHLFHGDDGLKQVFHLVYALLMPGGRFVLEPQKWKSYFNRKHTNATTQANYDRIALRPKDFAQYLCHTVGFSSVELLKVCSTSTHGFKRPIYLYTK
ncbi:hypothetical protein DYB30_008683, partial [Aphanomyces astaci]